MELGRLQFNPRQIVVEVSFSGQRSAPRPGAFRQGGGWVDAPIRFRFEFERGKRLVGRLAGWAGSLLTSDPPSFDNAL